MRNVVWVLPTIGIVFICEWFGLSYADSIAQAAEPVRLSQASNVSERSSGRSLEGLNVQPHDWAFTALRRLMAEYSCLDGYAAWLFRGDRSITRYEFARGINSCLDVVIETIHQKDDLHTIKRLQEEFAVELSVLRGSV